VVVRYKNNNSAAICRAVVIFGDGARLAAPNGIYSSAPSDTGINPKRALSRANQDVLRIEGVPLERIFRNRSTVRRSFCIFTKFSLSAIELSSRFLKESTTIKF
jgi:hypothetical protein